VKTTHRPADPVGQLTLQTLAMPRDTNPHGDIFGGWLLARQLTKGRVATVAVSDMGFLRPVPVGALVSCYTSLLETGRTSMRINIEVWIDGGDNGERAKVTEGDFVYVAISEDGKTRPVGRI